MHRIDISLEYKFISIGQSLNYYIDIPLQALKEVSRKENSRVSTKIAKVLLPLLRMMSGKVSDFTSGT